MATNSVGWSSQGGVGSSPRSAPVQQTAPGFQTPQPMQGTIDHSQWRTAPPSPWLQAMPGQGGTTWGRPTGPSPWGGWNPPSFFPHSGPWDNQPLQGGAPGAQAIQQNWMASPYGQLNQAMQGGARIEDVVRAVAQQRGGGGYPQWNPPAFFPQAGPWQQNPTGPGAQAIQNAFLNGGTAPAQPGMPAYTQGVNDPVTLLLHRLGAGSMVPGVLAGQGNVSDIVRMVAQQRAAEQGYLSGPPTAAQQQNWNQAIAPYLRPPPAVPAAGGLSGIGTGLRGY